MGMFGKAFSAAPKVEDYRFYGGADAAHYGPSSDGSVARMQPYYGHRWNEASQALDSPEMKSQGWLGPLQGPDGKVVSEYSIDADINGKNASFPSIVPGLSSDELQSVLQSSAYGGRIPDSVYEKAMAHAQMRMGQGLSPFWNPATDGGK